MVVCAQPFRLERQMLRPLVRALPTVLGLAQGTRLAVLQRPVVGAVIPDLLLGTWCDTSRRRRFSATHIQTHVLALIEKSGPQSLVEIARALWLNPSIAETAVEDLLRKKAITRDESGHLWLCNGVRSTEVEITAIEAKMKRWRKALEQAISYQTFADRSYVVLDGNQARVTTQMLEMFATSGVGLLLQFGFAVREVIAAPSSAQVTGDRYRALDRLLSRRTTTVSRIHSSISRSSLTKPAGE